METFLCEREVSYCGDSLHVVLALQRLIELRAKSGPVVARVGLALGEAQSVALGNDVVEGTYEVVGLSESLYGVEVVLSVRNLLLGSQVRKGDCEPIHEIFVVADIWQLSVKDIFLVRYVFQRILQSCVVLVHRCHAQLPEQHDYVKHQVEQEEDPAPEHATAFYLAVLAVLYFLLF